MTHTVEDYGRPEYLDGSMMQYALSNESGERNAYVGGEKRARLYAAAPDLYEALQALLRYATKYDGFGRDYEVVTDRAYAALAKARGEVVG